MKTPMIVLAAGLLMLAIGVWMQMTAGAPSAEPALAQQCRDAMKSRGADAAMIEQCSQKAFATTVTATDAQAAARAISAANNSEVGGYGASMLLIGLGVALSIGGGLNAEKPSLTTNLGMLALQAFPQARQWLSAAAT